MGKYRVSAPNVVWLAVLGACVGGWGAPAWGQASESLDDSATESDDWDYEWLAQSDAAGPDDAGEPSDDVPVIALPQASKKLEKTAPPPDEIHLEEMVVTARKREETIQEVPLSVTPFLADEMEKRGFSGLEDVAAATPGFTFEGFASGGAHGNPVIRGLAQQFTTSRIQNVSFFLDGVYLQRQSMLNLGMIDMQRVEVVKGPQNALYGRNAFAGAVNYVTLRPDSTPEGYFFAGIGDNQRREYRFSMSGPLDEYATFFGKFTAGKSDYDGHTENNHPVADADPAGPNQRGNLGGWDDTVYSLSLAWEPSNTLMMRASYYRSELIREAAPSYSISGVNAARFGFRYDDQNDLNCNEVTVSNIGVPYQSHTGFSLYCGELPNYASDIAPRTVDGIVIDPRAIGSTAETDAVTFSTDFFLTDEISLHYLFGLAMHESYTDGGASDEDPLAGRGITTNALISAVDNQNPSAFTFANTASSRPNSELESFSHELRLDWEVTPSLRSSFGLYYSVVEDEEWTTLFIADLCNADTPENIENCNQPLSHPNSLEEETVVTVGVAYDQYTRQHADVRSEWTAFEDRIMAGFASFSYLFTDTVEGTLEARYTIEDKAVERFTDSSGLEPGQTVTYNPPQDPVLPLIGNSLESAIVVPRDDERFTYFTPRAILNWDWAEGHLLYASAAKGVKSGGFNNADDASELTYGEATNWTYEIGSKNSFFHRTITLNGAIYYIEWEGLQGGVPPSNPGLSTSDIITNIGGASSYGIEIEGAARLPYGFSIDVGLSYNDPTYDDGVSWSAGESEDGSFHCNGTVCATDGDVSGNQLPRTSKEQYSAGINYDRAIFGNWHFGSRIDTNYQSEQYLTPLNLAWVPERLITNASMQFSDNDGNWEISFWGKNITDEDYPANAFVIGVFNQYLVAKGAGRTIGANVKFNF